MCRPESDVRFPEKMVIPTRDLILQYRSRLAGLTLSPAAFEELVRQCLDMYIEWQGDETEFGDLPNLNPIEIPELRGEHRLDVYRQVVQATGEFAAALQQRLIETGLFLDGNMKSNIDYGFDRFIGNDILLFHFPF
ncbi:hypothetical protein [Paraburkholderia sp. BCC1886]|uniref:hypothetical protein n=1 Tax=Paraburkholderia sp. BCC1886 TaxID=2562670 RepID=UPI001181D64D|nr:hypothetical protein [Paraburkholderia sp. BCC1886]